MELSKRNQIPEFRKWKPQSPRANGEGIRLLNKAVYLPAESFGRCRNARHCRKHLALLADELCVSCWDRKNG